jgi:hypothetical protein
MFAIIGLSLREEFGLTTGSSRCWLPSRSSRARSCACRWASSPTASGGGGSSPCCSWSPRSRPSSLQYATTYASLLVAAFLLGLSGASFAVGVAWVSAWYPADRQGFALGTFGAGNVGASITKLLAPTGDHRGRCRGRGRRAGPGRLAVRAVRVRLRAGGDGGACGSGPRGTTVDRRRGRALGISSGRWARCAPGGSGSTTWWCSGRTSRCRCGSPLLRRRVRLGSRHWPGCSRRCSSSRPACCVPLGGAPGRPLRRPPGDVPRVRHDDRRLRAPRRAGGPHRRRAARTAARARSPSSCPGR